MAQLVCGYCGKEIPEYPKRKFCSMECTKHGQKRHYGSDHPNWKLVTRRKNRRGKHGSWARAVLSRDKGTCQHCGVQNVGLHAHHILPFATHPEKRWDVDNGITLCYQCHEAEHAALRANGVNSGNIRPGKAEDNPEPSDGRKPVEGVTTRGRAFRRWYGHCDECGAFISKAFSDVTGKSALFCNRTCRGKWTSRNMKGKPRTQPFGSNASTSAPPERDDIV